MTSTTHPLPGAQLPLPGLPRPAEPPGPAPGSTPVVVSWGLGVDSSDFLARVLGDQQSQPLSQTMSYDPASMIVIHAVTGDEWQDTLADAERHILPLLREHGVRLVQVARAGRFEADGVEVLDDSSCPRRLHRAGPWRLSDELRTTGTVPMVARGRRTCSIKFMGSVIDRFIAAELRDRLYRHVLGFNAEEGMRVLRDQTYTSLTRAPEYPLIEWGYGRAECLALLRERFGITWRKSYCAQCPFPGNIGSLPQHLQRLRAFPERAAEVLMLEHSALALNPNSRLFGTTTLHSHVAADHNTDALVAFRRAQLASSWSLYRVRRIIWARGDGQAKGPAWRSVEPLSETRTRDEAIVQLQRQAAERGGGVEFDEHSIARSWVLRRGGGFPAREWFDVVAPATCPPKVRYGFAGA